MLQKFLLLAPLFLCARLLLAADARPLPSAPPATPGPAGSILVEYFRGVAGAAVSDLVNNPAFPLHPTDAELIKSFEFDPGDEQYGSLTRGYVIAPTTGNYTFFIAADDSAELYLSTDDSPNNRRKIAACPTWVDPRAWDRMPEQKSAPIALEAGHRYYIEAWHKQEGGPGHLAVGWQLPGGQKELPIPGSRLMPAGKPKAPEPLKITVTLNPATPAATAPGQHKFPNDATVDRNGITSKMSYLIRLPKDYDKTTDRKPMFIFLCGNSHQGSNLDGILNEGPAQFLNDVPQLREFWPFVGLFPQPPDGSRWDTPGMPETVIALIDQIVKKYRVDPDRIYLSGLSMGGKGTWLVAECAPDRFAAIAPISAVEVKPDRAADVLKYLPMWIICGSDDGPFTDGSKRMAQAIKSNGGTVDLTVFPNEGHGVWGRFYPEPRFYQWLLKHTRTKDQALKSAATTQPTR
jgi:hypothetical protein